MLTATPNNNVEFNADKQAVCIIGAGPAGLYTAISLAKHNIPSILVDKAVFPRDKVCGEALTSAVLRYLHRLDPGIVSSDAFLNARKVINGVNFHAPGGQKFYMPFHSNANENMGLDSFIGIRRIELDNILMNLAKQNPLIKVIENLALKDIEVLEDGFILYDQKKEIKIDAGMLVIANGYNSSIAQTLTNWGDKEKVHACGITAFYKNVTGISDSDTGECFVLPELKSGGMYVLPVGDGIVNVNIAVHASVQKKHALNLRKLMADALATHPILKKAFANAEEVRKPLGCGYFLGIRKRKVSGKRFLLIGDAGGFNDAISANGIAHAMMSADIAVQTIVKAHKLNDYSSRTFASYDKQVYKAFRQVRNMGMLMKPFMLRYKILFSIVDTFFTISARSSDLASMVLYAKDPWKLFFKRSFYSALWKVMLKKQPENIPAA